MTELWGDFHGLNFTLDFEFEQAILKSDLRMLVDALSNDNSIVRSSRDPFSLCRRFLA